MILLDKEAAVQRAGSASEVLPPAIAPGYGSAWAADPSDGSVERIDLAQHTVADRIPVGGTPGAVAVGGGSVWTASVPGEALFGSTPTRERSRKESGSAEAASRRSRWAAALVGCRCDR